jgi:Na+/melibiose symporter-like transporter
MDKTTKNDDKSTWAIGGGVLMGIGAGFFFLKESPLAFVACILLGIGLGLMITSIISGGRVRKTKTE